MPTYDPSDPFRDDDVDYYGYGEEPPEYVPTPIQGWKSDRDARQAAEDAETARRVAAHPGYDDPRFFERQAAMDNRTPGTYCPVHNRFFGVLEAVTLKGRCSWCNPELHPSYKIAHGQTSGEKKALAEQRKAQQTQEEIANINEGIRWREQHSDDYLMVSLDRKCLDCDVVLKAGQKYRCQPCVDAAYAAIPEKYRGVLSTAPAE